MSRWSNAGKKILWSLSHRGLPETLRVMARRLRPGGEAVRQHPFDAIYGVDTSGLIGGGDLTAGHAHDVHITGYVGIAPSRFRAMLERWQATPGVGAIEDYSFADLGCGKGRAVLLASSAGFREVTGVELNVDLAQTAEANVRIWGERARCPVRIVCGDATEFVLPEGPCLIYLANPFGAPVMRLLLRRLSAQVSRRTAALDVLYQNPEQEDIFAEVGGFRLLWSEKITMSPEDQAVDPVFTQDDRCNAYRVVV